MDNKTKKVITEEWLNAFPELSAFDQNKLYKVIGPFVCGIELIKLPRIEKYRPHFAIYPLFKEGIEKCLKTPFVTEEFYNTKGNQIDLPYDDKGKNYLVAQSIIKNSSKLNLDLSTYRVHDFLKLADYYLYSHNDAWYKNHSGLRASLFSLKFFATSYVLGSEEELSTIKNKIEYESRNWNMQMFETWYGKFDIWFQNLQKTIANRDEFLKQIEINKQNKKIAKLKSSELTA